MTLRPLAVALLLAASVLAVSPTEAADPATCAALASVARAPGEVAQNDADSGGDAGDAPSAATPLAQMAYSYSWGFVEPGVAHDFGDFEDWFSIELKGGGGPVMAEVNATLVRSTLYPYSLVDPDGPLRFQLVAFPPDGGEPLVGVANGNGGTRVRFTDAVAGTWLFQVRLPHVAGGALACAGPHPTPAVDDPASPAPATNYGVYFGCHPHCVK